MDLDALLKPYQRFGVHLGLERINCLLANLGNPHKQIPIIHVAGTNGKGSVCAYLSSVLTQAGYRVGRYTSPHLIDWTERICVNEQPISREILAEILQKIQCAINPNQESPTQFEVITAAAWLYFAQSQVDIAVIEVGLGGRLDATNVCSQPLLTVITSISREHWQVLGPTISHIAREKAGILKPGCPAIIGILPLEAQQVIRDRIMELNCPSVWVQPSRAISQGWAQYLANEEIFPNPQSQIQPLYPFDYPLPLLGEIQLQNSAMAIACLQVLQQKGWNISAKAMEKGMSQARWLGRIQWTKWKGHELLIDGAHNPAAAQALRKYVDTLKKPVTWVMGILSTKDHQEIFQALLRQGDKLYLVPVPDHSSAKPDELALLARQICPHLREIGCFDTLATALDNEINKSNPSDEVVILCGSLYLVGYFLQISDFEPLPVK